MLCLQSARRDARRTCGDAELGARRPIGDFDNLTSTPYRGTFERCLMAKINVVRLSSTAKKQIRRIPQHIVDKLLAWVLLIETKGIHDLRKIPGYHDEPLQGLRQGQRSIRLSRSYRAIYTQLETNEVWCVQVEEIHKHAY